MCNNDKRINNFNNKCSDGTHCNCRRELKRYYENKDKISNQQKLYYEKSREKIMLQIQNKKYIQFKDLVRSFVELDDRLKLMDEKFAINDSGNN